MFTYLLCATCLECNAEQQFAVKLFLHVRRNSNAVNTFVTVVVRDFSCGELVISWAAWRVHLDRRRCWQLQNVCAAAAATTSVVSLWPLLQALTDWNTTDDDMLL